MITKAQIKTAITAILVLALTLFMTNNNTKLQSKISVLRGQNEILETQNRSLEKNLKALVDSIAKIDKSIQDLKGKEAKLAKENVELENNIKKLNKKYEKAINHSANYNADSIRGYFSNFQ